MKEPSPSSTKATKDIERIINRLEEAVQELPLKHMISSVWIPGEQSVSHENAKELKDVAWNAIRQLSMLAATGSEDALVALRDIGNQAANELESLPPNEFRHRISKAFPGPFASQARFFHPVVELQGDLSALTKILRSEKNTIDNLAKNAVTDSILKLKIPGRGRFVVNALEPLGFPEDLLDEHRHNTSQKSVHFKHPDLLMNTFRARIKDDASLTPQQKEQESARIVLFELILHLLGAQIDNLANTQVENLRQRSFEWPMCVSAFSRDVRERFESLNLGASLPFRPNGAKNKTGRPQKFVPGTSIHFAMEYCVELENARRNHPNATDDEKEAWMNAVSLKETELNDPESNYNNKNRENVAYHDDFLRTLWDYKARLLPKTPSFGNGGDSGPYSDLELWLDAALARARMLCWNDWENYKWPKCVEARRKQNKNRFRSAEDVVREKLREGMKQLVSVPPATL